MHNELKVKDHVYLRVKPRRSSRKIRNCAKLTPRFCGPFEVLDRIGPITYKITFPTNMKAHNVFHLSLLKIYVHNPNDIIEWDVIQVDPKGEF